MDSTDSLIDFVKASEAILNSIRNGQLSLARHLKNALEQNPSQFTVEELKKNRDALAIAAERQEDTSKQNEILEVVQTIVVILEGRE
jgi:hypothetical protein